MGKVLSGFDLGWPGAIARSVDDIVITMKNVDVTPIEFGRPVFLADDGSGVKNFITSVAGTPQEFSKFVGFAVRNPAKTPDTYPDGQDPMTGPGYQAGKYAPGDLVEILVRGTMSVRMVTGANVGGKAYIRKIDGSIVPGAGAANSTVDLSNVRVRTPQLGSGVCSELVILNRNTL